MKKYKNFLSENFQFLVAKFSVYLNRQVFVMFSCCGSFCNIYILNVSIYDKTAILVAVHFSMQNIEQSRDIGLALRQDCLSVQV